MLMIKIVDILDIHINYNKTIYNLKNTLLSLSEASDNNASFIFNSLV